MLEGNELEGKLGEVGGYIIDIDDKGFFKAEAKAGKEGDLEAGAYIKGDVLALLRKLSAQTGNTVDDKLVEMVAGALGR